MNDILTIFQLSLLDDTLPSNILTTDVPIAVIAGGGVCIFIVVVLIGLLGVVLPCVVCVRRSKREVSQFSGCEQSSRCIYLYAMIVSHLQDHDMKDDTPKVANTYSGIV